MKSVKALSAAMLLASSGTASALSPKHMHFEAVDPCAQFREHACKSNNICVWTERPKNSRAGRKDRENYGRHSGPAGREGSCGLKHVTDRPKMNANDKARLAAFGFSSDMDTMACEEAAFLKDCKDLNQHHHANVCQWNCDSGCHARPDDATGRVYEFGSCPLAAIALKNCDDGTEYAPGMSISGDVQDYVDEDGNFSHYFRLLCMVDTGSTVEQGPAAVFVATDDDASVLDQGDLAAVVNDADASYPVLLWDDNSEYTALNSGECFDMFGDSVYLDSALDIAEMCDMAGVVYGSST